MFNLGYYWLTSDYVKDELNFARSKGKKIYPVYLEPIKLPLSLELLLGRSQAISYSDDDIKESRFKLREKIKSNLPGNVFQVISDPFYAGEKNCFYLEDTSTIFPENTYFAGEPYNSFAINKVDVGTGEKSTVYRYHARAAYDMFYSLNNVAVFDDPYFCDDDSKVLFLSMALSFSGKYPVPWPNIDVVLTIAISRIESASPRVTLVDYKCIGEHSDEDWEFINGVIGEIEKSFVK